MNDPMAVGSSPGAWPGPIAADLLRVVLHDSQGSLPRYGLRERAGNARRLDVTLRAALFCDLARAGLIIAERGPVAVSAAGSPAGSPGSPGSRRPAVGVIRAVERGRNPPDRKPPDGDLADGNLADGNLADGNLADGNLADGNLADENLAHPTLVDPNRSQGTSAGRTPADPMLADPMLADPMLANPMLADPMLADPILAAVLAAVAQRPELAWARWFRHVRGDRAALVERLVGSGRWTAHGNRFRDGDPGGAERSQARAFTVSELIEAPADDRETMLGYLYALSGPTMPAERVAGWDVRLAQLGPTPSGRTVRTVLAAARVQTRLGRLGRR